MYGSLLPQCILGHASLQGKAGGQDAQAIHAQESKKAAREKAKAVVEQLRSMKLKEAAKKVEDGIEETLTYCDFPVNTGLASVLITSLNG